MGFLTSVIPGIIGMGAGIATANPWLIGGSALGMGKGLEDQQNADNQRQAQAELTRYSPWTGISGQAVANPSGIGSAVQGAGMGLGLGQNMDKFAAEQAALKAQIPAPTGNEYTSTGGVANNPANAGSLSKGLQMASPSPYALMPKGSAGSIQGAGPGVSEQTLALQNSPALSRFNPWNLQF